MSNSQDQQDSGENIGKPSVSSKNANSKKLLMRKYRILGASGLLPRAVKVEILDPDAEEPIGIEFYIIFNGYSFPLYAHGEDEAIDGLLEFIALIERCAREANEDLGRHSGPHTREKIFAMVNHHLSLNLSTSCQPQRDKIELIAEGDFMPPDGSTPMPRYFVRYPKGEKIELEGDLISIRLQYRHHQSQWEDAAKNAATASSSATEVTASAPTRFRLS